MEALTKITQTLELLSKNIQEINKTLEEIMIVSNVLDKRLKELERTKLHTEDAAARILGVSTDEVVRLREEGKLAFKKFAPFGEWKTTIPDIEEYLNVHGEQE